MGPGASSRSPWPYLSRRPQPFGTLTARTVAGKQATFDWDPLGQAHPATIDGRHTGMVYDAAGERGAYCAVTLKARRRDR
ncbi:hypothetical protein ACU635_24795 [[Actinomadura] parvosata]|uniref:hypothetical protein n=1 Tax=[Actinomadura] parvosata TaxID=1955412 RepID=UPI00406D2391